MTKIPDTEHRSPQSKFTLFALLGLCGVISYNLLAGQDLDAVRLGRTAVSVQVEEAGNLPDIEPQPPLQVNQNIGNSDMMGELIEQTMDNNLPAKQSALVLSIQQNLYALGLYDGLIDGKSGTQTRAAIRQFQMQNGISADGYATTRLLERTEYARKISEASNITGSVTDKTPSVSAIQLKLTLLGYDPGPVDGVFGKSTKNAIRQFEKDRRMTATGQISPDLLAALQM